MISLQVEYGNSISLNCSQNAFWNLNHKALFLRKNKYLADNSTLIIYNATPSDAGIYSCGTEKMYTVTVLKPKKKDFEENIKDETSNQLSTTYIYLISMFGFIFAATFLLLLMAFIYKKRRSNRNDSGVYAEIDESFLIQVNDIHNDDEVIDECEEILPRNIQIHDSPEIPNLCETSEYVYPQDYDS